MAPLPSRRAPAGGGDFSSNTATSVDGEAVVFSGAGGKTGRRATGSGVAKLTAGVLGTAVAGTDYVAPAGNVATATALAANGTNCGAGQAAQGVDAAGNAEGCFTPAGGSALTIQEVDGTPTGTPSVLKVSNGTLTDNGDGSFTLVTGAGTGGGITASSTDTLTNKRITQRTTSLAGTSTSFACSIDTSDECQLTSTAPAGTITFPAPGGTPADGDTLLYRLRCTNSQVLTFDAAFLASPDSPLPSTCPANLASEILFGMHYAGPLAQWQLQGATGLAPAAGGGGDFSSNTTVSVDGEVLLFSGTGGKTGKRATGTGLAKLTAGVQSTVAAPTGPVVGETDAQTLTNKRVPPRVTTLTSAATNPSFQCNFAQDQCEIQATGSAGNLTMQLPTGTMQNGEMRMALFLCTAQQSFIWDAIFIASPAIPLPTTCPAGVSAWFAVGFRWSSVLNKFQIFASN